MTDSNSKSVAHDRPIDSAPPRHTHMATSRYPLGHWQDSESSRPINAQDCDLPIGPRLTQPPQLPEDLDQCSTMAGCPLWVDIRSQLADATSNPNSSPTIWQWFSSMGEFGGGRNLSERQVGCLGCVWNHLESSRRLLYINPSARRPKLSTRYPSELASGLRLYLPALPVTCDLRTATCASAKPLTLLPCAL